MKVTNLLSTSGNKIANQFNIEVNGVDYFQSYDTVIARYKPLYLEVTDDYNYSNTTSKYFRQWLKQWGYTDKDIDKLKKMLSNIVTDTEFKLKLNNGSILDVYYTKDGYNL